MALQGANARLQAGEFAAGNRSSASTSARRSATPADVGQRGRRARAAARRSTCATWPTVREGFGEPTDYVSHARRGARRRAGGHDRGGQAARAPTRPTVAHAVLERVDAARGRLLPADVHGRGDPRLRRDGGREGDELILHLLIATLSVTVLIWLFLGWREALVVLVAVPVTLALTLFVYYALGYTLNRITLFALIFSIGILVDDAIVVVENIYRHLADGRPHRRGGRGRGGGRGRQPDDPRHLHGDRGDPADGVRVGADGAVHAADPGRRLGGDARLARRWRSSSRRSWRSACCKGHVAHGPRMADRGARAGGGVAASRGSTPAS